MKKATKPTKPQTIEQVLEDIERVKSPHPFDDIKNIEKSRKRLQLVDQRLYQIAYGYYLAQRYL